MTPDASAGTVYRAFAEAIEVVELARFHGDAGVIGYNPEAATHQIDRAIAALTDARAQLSS